MQRTFQSDYELGIQEEIALLPRLQAALKDPSLRRDARRNAPWDYYNADRSVFAELKTLRTRKEVYPAQLIGTWKVDWARAHPESRFFLCYKFGFDPDSPVEFWEVDPETQLARRLMGRKDRGLNEVKPHYMVPNEVLRPLNELKNAGKV